MRPVDCSMKAKLCITATSRSAALELLFICARSHCGLLGVSSLSQFHAFHVQNRCGKQLLLANFVTAREMQQRWFCRWYSL
eukprot:m.613 g.613  ORF g.613 m.613 type:complete len:81 (+) comp848_c0_seq2:915-1157(+)